VTDDARYAELMRWVERQETRLDEQDERLDEIERRQTVLDAGLAIARWLIAILIPVSAIVVAVWRG